MHFVAAVTVLVDYSGDPRCTEAEQEVAAAPAAAAAAAAVVAVAAAVASEPVAESIHSDLRFH